LGRPAQVQAVGPETAHEGGPGRRHLEDGTVAVDIGDVPA
jgi:hypothetical protein